MPHRDPPANAILDSARTIVTRLLTQHGFPLAEPVGAGFHECAHGSTGVTITVKLSEPRWAPAVRAALTERYGGAGGVDVFRVA